MIQFPVGLEPFGRLIQGYPVFVQDINLGGQNNFWGLRGKLLPLQKWVAPKTITQLRKLHADHEINWVESLPRVLRLRHDLPIPEIFRRGVQDLAREVVGALQGGERCPPFGTTP